MKKIFVCLLIASLSVFCNLSAFAQNPSYQQNSSKMMQMLQAINNMYVDTVNFEPLVEKGIVEMLKELDPHSVYIPKKEVQQTNEPLEGKFDEAPKEVIYRQISPTGPKAVLNAPAPRSGNSGSSDKMS